MSKAVYVTAAHVVSPLGIGIDEHWKAVENGKAGVQSINDKKYSDIPFYGGHISDTNVEAMKQVVSDFNLTRFEHAAIYSATEALRNTSVTISPEETIFILSTTKGNIEQLNEIADERILLQYSATTISKGLNIRNMPIVISQACVSGSVALLYVQRLLQLGRYKNAIVTGCDMLTPFVLKGFQSFQAIADGQCRPFDKARTGINLGESAATMILSTQKPESDTAILSGGATSNDANHISGPSRTGEELADAIKRALSDSGVEAEEVDMVSAHGTATAYNDEMEAKALHLSGLNDCPVHSFKSYTGHTLGAAGILESIMALEAMKRNSLIPSLNYEEHGVPVPLNVTTENTSKEVNHVLKTASGFGGSNAAIVWSKT